MTWFQARKRAARSPGKDQLASRAEVSAELEAQKDYLHWLALLITGDSAKALASVVSAGELSIPGRGVFREWIERWVRSATARAAVQQVREAVADAAAMYADWSCSHEEHEAISDEKLMLLQQIDPQEIITQLDAFARTILVFKGLQHASTSDCSVQLDVTRRCVVGAYCRALQWVQTLDQKPIRSQAESSITCTQANE